MRGIDGLIRLSKWTLDEKRRVIVDLEVLRSGLERQIQALDEELERERKFAATSMEAGYSFANYRRVNRERVDRLMASREEVIAKIAIAQDDVNEAFRELKKYELVKETRLAAAAREQAKREQAELDEAGLQGFLRQQQSDANQNNGQPGNTEPAGSRH
ncbi:flagellar FliJ family protein [Ferrovibrio sp.]|uniref:flagellar FliJ family protein n=1 Tax=Ferrovibrio sp. TaxID=1917215 RepID=UPI0025C47C57|nr:flagellar FliJ family protein [Ferrovibrio sp.]MBX3454487.1 flagellar FliJ family protein [Ferrovibrio sp.]